MRVLRDFRCTKCGFEFEEKTEYGEHPSCQKCHADTQLIFKKFPSFKIHGYSEKNGYARGATKEERDEIEKTRHIQNAAKHCPTLELGATDENGYTEVL